MPRLSDNAPWLLPHYTIYYLGKYRASIGAWAEQESLAEVNVVVDINYFASHWITKVGKCRALDER